MSPRERLANAARGVNWLTIAKALSAVLIPVAVAAGFDFKTPAKKFHEVETKIEASSKRIDTVQAQVAAGVASVETLKRSVNEGFDLIFRLSCLDSAHYSQRDLRLAGLNCRDLLNERPVSQAGRVR